MEPVIQPRRRAEPAERISAHTSGHEDTKARRGIATGTSTIDTRPDARFSSRLAAGFLAVFAVLSSAAVDGQSRPRDYDVKAVYLFNFGRFATWPETVTAAEGPSINVCVIGRDPFGMSLDSTLAGEKINGKAMIVRRITVAKDAAGCRILFVSASEEPQVAQILGALGRSGVLTVSDLPGFAAQGGMIEFVLHENRVRFEVNLTAAEQANLKLSSELLKVATTVRRAGRPGS